MTDATEHRWWFDDVGNILCSRHAGEFYLQGEYRYDEEENGKVINVRETCIIHGGEELPCAVPQHWPIRCKCRNTAPPQPGDTRVVSLTMPPGARLSNVGDVHRMLGMHVQFPAKHDDEIVHNRYIVTGARLEWDSATSLEKITLGLMHVSKIDDGTTKAVDLYAPKEGS